jgi:hypothetical protein
VSVVPGGRFSGLDRCGTPSGGVGRVPAAACTVPSGAGTGGDAGEGLAGSAGAAAGSAAAGGASHGSHGNGLGGAGAGAGSGAGAGGAGSANAVGALKINAATIPSAPDNNVTAVASRSITDGPLPVTTVRRCYRVNHSASQNCYTCACCDKEVNLPSARRNTFHFEFRVTPCTVP